MDHGACNVIYVDRRANDEHVRRELLSKSVAARTSTGSVTAGYFGFSKAPSPDIHANVEAILSTFSEVHICRSGSACLDKISQLQDSSKGSTPTIVLIDIPYDEEKGTKPLSPEPRTPSPTHGRPTRTDTTEPDDFYGMSLLMHVSSEIQSKSFSKLVIPVVMLSGLDRDWASNTLPSPSVHGSQVLTDTIRLVRYLDAGAVDVVTSPLAKDRAHGLAIHAYRVHKEMSREGEAALLSTKKNRKLSWVGVNDTKPYAYLRESMVSTLMSGICEPESIGNLPDSAHEDPNRPNYLAPDKSRRLDLSQDRQEFVAKAIGSWSFSAHEFTDDELVFYCLLMLKHALQMPELEQWNMPDDDLTAFLLASRSAYNDFVLYHNFRHVTDVLQALFHFLVEIGTLPPYLSESASTGLAEPTPMAELLKPFDALTLLISAIGHDVGHPGVNNAFLVALNAPLAQLYNDRSVLESFHCAAYSQILRRYWPRAFSDATMRRLMINSILATDMGLHFRYMTDLGNLQSKLAIGSGVVDSWSGKVREDQKDLACGILIKCADISNVARKFDTAAKWANVLTDEFSNQGVMEQELQIPSCLFGGPPVRDNLIKLGESQLGFMNIFARPLFEAVADILPAMHFTVEELITNKEVWEKKIKEEREQNKKNASLKVGLTSPSFSTNPTPSPCSQDAVKTPFAVSVPLPVQTSFSHISLPKSISQEDYGLRGSNGSVSAGQPTSRRSSKCSSGAGLPEARAMASYESPTQSRRGSGDASLTAILVTETSNATDKATKDGDQGFGRPRSTLPGDRKDTLTKSSPKKYEGEKKSARPVTAPSSARCSQATNLFPVPHAPSQSHSEVDLSHTANGNLDDPKSQQWGDDKVSGDSNVTRSDALRDSNRRSEWWRQMSTRRRTRDMRNGDDDARGQHKEMMLDPTSSNTTSDTTYATMPSPGRNSRTGKLKNFFKWKPRNSTDDEKQLSSFGSSNNLRTPPTSDPGHSVNSDD